MGGSGNGLFVLGPVFMGGSGNGLLPSSTDFFLLFGLGFGNLSSSF